MQDLLYILNAFFVTLGVCFLVLELCSVIFGNPKVEMLVYLFDEDGEIPENADIIIRNSVESETILTAINTVYPRIYITRTGSGEEEWNKK